MGAVLLDTTVLIDVLRGRPEAAARLRRLRDQGDTAFVCAVSAEEIARGVRPREEAAAEMLLAALRTAPLSTAEGWVAGEWRRRYAARGRTLSQANCLIAASALAIGGRIATGNPKHFPMADLDVEHWPVGA
jgi:predicted nucleic acid-binding protein